MNFWVFTILYGSEILEILFVSFFLICSEQINNFKPLKDLNL